MIDSSPSVIFSICLLQVPMISSVAGVEVGLGDDQFIGTVDKEQGLISTHSYIHTTTYIHAYIQP
jgi:hypothetical protein